MTVSHDLPIHDDGLNRAQNPLRNAKASIAGMIRYKGDARRGQKNTGSRGYEQSQHRKTLPIPAGVEY
jgi:hypothetical protein